MSFFECKNVEYSYSRSKVLDGVSFTVEKGEVAALLGANGSGKTTFIKAACSLIAAKGRFTLGGEALKNKTERELASLISYIPQRSGITISLSVMDVVLMGFNSRMSLLERYNDIQRAQALDALRDVGMEQMADRDYLSLSEGEKQLCILARTFIEGSRLMILDEPESSLDFKNRYKVMQLIRERVEKAEGTALICLHEPSLALQFCDRLILLEGGKCIAQLLPKSDSIEKMEEYLSRIYGEITLHRINGRLVMLPR